MKIKVPNVSQYMQHVIYKFCDNTHTEHRAKFTLDLTFENMATRLGSPISYKNSRDIMKN